MTAYLIQYQIRRHSSISIPQGDWQDEKKVVVVVDDARDAVGEIVQELTGHDFLLKGVTFVGRVDKVSKMILSKINP